MDATELRTWSDQGLIPGPEEALPDFEVRCRYCLNLKDSIQATLKETLPFDAAPLPSLLWEEVHQVTSTHFGIKPDWVPVFFSNKQLAPWQGGAVWIFQQSEQSPLGAFIQLKHAFAKQKTFLGIYDRTELMSHECAHIGRMLFDEPEFEEMLAYSTSKNAFRRWLGPLIKSARQIRGFMIFLVAIIMMDIAVLAMNQTSLYFDLMWLKLIPAGMILMGLWGLHKRHQAFDLCLANLKSLYPKEASAIQFRLTDKEIYLFAKSAPQSIEQYIEAQECLRWQAIRSLMG